MLGHEKRPGDLPDLPIGRCLVKDASTSVVIREASSDLGSLQLASGHFARLVVAFHLVAKLLAFDDFAHAGPLDSGDVNKYIGAAVIRLNEAEALCGIEPFNCASGHNEPFQ
ncbi:hypothetical protein GGD55_004694 [Rhizobium giardinii]|uniref:Uncharacterized protein n=1 Tax=Rhizobium giardinii TaxID=56731 RepID=A0A7W8UER1_9HYPH|nr:hypothetical protein [Rhizobium giardinii]